MNYFITQECKMKYMRRVNQLTIAFLMAGAVSATVFAANDSDGMAGMKGMADMQGHGMHDMSGMKGMNDMQETKPGQAALVDGQVKKVDPAQGKITLKHGPIENLGMPGMTMVFRVSKPEMLDGVNAGDAVKFHAEKINGALTVTRLEK